MDGRRSLLGKVYDLPRVIYETFNPIRYPARFVGLASIAYIVLYTFGEIKKGVKCAEAIAIEETR